VAAQSAPLAADRNRALQGYLDVLKWFVGDDNDLHPGKPGITISIKYLPILTDAIVKAHAVAVARGLVTDNVEYLDRGGR
jgi:hypothetical protein